MGQELGQQPAVIPSPSCSVGDSNGAVGVHAGCAFF